MGLTMSEQAYNTLIQEKARTESQYKELWAKYEALLGENGRLRHLLAGKQLSEIPTTQTAERDQLRKTIGEQQQEIEKLKRELASANESQKGVVISPAIGQPIPGKSTASK